MQVGVGLEVRGERDPLARRVPGRLGDVEVAGRQLARARAGPGGDDVEVLAPSELRADVAGRLQRAAAQYAGDPGRAEARAGA